MRRILHICATLLLFTPCIVIGQDKDVISDSLLAACKDKKDYITCLNGYIENYSDDRSLLKILDKKGRYYLLRGQYDSVIAVGRRGVTISAKDSNLVNLGAFTNLIGTGEYQKGNNSEAAKRFIQAAGYIESAGDTLRVAILKSNVGNIYLQMKDYESAKELIKDAYLILKQYGDSNRMLLVLSMLALNQLHLEDTTSAKSNAQLAYNLSRSSGNDRAMARAAGVLGDIYNEQQRYDSSIYYFNETLKLSEPMSVDYNIRVAKLGLIRGYLNLGEYRNAEQIAKGLKNLIDKNGSPEDKQKFYRLYADILGVKGRYRDAYNSLNIAYELQNTVAGAESKKIVNEIRTKYETEKKDRKLAENQLELQSKEAELSKHNLYLLLLAIFVAALMLAIILVRMRSRHKIQRLNEQKRLQVLRAQVAGEEKERKRIARELHDGIASELAVIKMNLENMSDILPDKENAGQLKLLADIAVNAHRETRRISHNLYPVQLINKGVINAIKDYLEGLPVDANKIETHIVGDSEVKLSLEKQLLVFRLIQELTGNALKHSNAENILVDMSVSDELINMTVEDDGTGIAADKKEDPASFTTIKENILVLEGSYDISSKIDSGTSIMISIPNSA